MPAQRAGGRLKGEVADLKQGIWPRRPLSIALSAAEDRLDAQQRRGYFYMKLPRTLWAADTNRGCGLSRTYAYLPCKAIPPTLDPSAKMSIQEIEAAITKLSAEDLAILAAWFAEYRAQTWEKQIEHDLDAGRLDALLAEVDAEYEAGQAKPL